MLVLWYSVLEEKIGVGRGDNDLFLTKVLDKPDLRSEVKSESKSKSRSKCRDHNDYLGSLYLS